MQQVGVRAAVALGATVEDQDADAALVVAAQRDPAAFGPLYVRYADAVHRYCARRLDDPEAAADATAAIFVRALAALPRYRERSFRAWLFRIAHNEVIDDYRRSACRRHTSLDAAAELQDATPTPEETALEATSRPPSPVSWPNCPTGSAALSTPPLRSERRRGGLRPRAHPHGRQDATAPRRADPAHGAGRARSRGGS